MSARPVLAVHGGAGAIARGHLEAAGAERIAAARTGLRTALEAGAAVLARGGAALDAVEAAVRVLEDDPAFNAGRGAALNADGEAEHDAAIADGEGGRTGAVCAVRRLRAPVSAARLVLERSPHALLAAAGAERFALAQGAEAAEPSWFVTERAQRDLERVRARQQAESRGTVGAVALDAAGRLAAATSTGGISGKLPGRVGDTPLIGAGTWADRTCAVSATGAGEAFIRAGFAHQVAALVAAGAHPRDAARQALARVHACGGDGGAIIVDRRGRIALVQDADMFRGEWDGAAFRVAVFGEEG